MPNINNLPRNHGRKYTSQAYLDIRPDDPVIFDDSTYSHTQLGRHKLTRKARENVKPYEETISRLQKYTWGSILTEKGMVKRFRKVAYKPNSATFFTKIPPQFLIDNDLDDKEIDVVGMFDYTEALRFGGILFSNGIFYVFWIDQKKSNIYKHTN